MDVSKMRGASADVTDWVIEEMEGVDLGDKRLHKRLLLILQRMFDSPVASLKAACRGWAETIATYRFLDNEQVTEASLLEPHQDATLERVRVQPRVLVIQDTTEIDYSSKKELKGAGPLSVEERQGFFAHSQYVVTPERLPLGVWGTMLYAREGDGEKVGKNQPIEMKESYRWLEGYRDTCRLAELARETQTISVCDREGDIYEVFLEWQKRCQNGQPVAEWLIRSCHDRCLVPFEKSQEGLEQPDKLRAAVEQSPPLGTIDFYVTKQVGNKKVRGNRVKTFRQPRRVVQELRAIEVVLKAPWRRGQKLETVKIGVVLAREVDPPAGQDRIEWVLLTSLPVNTFEAAEEVIGLYLARWDIEVFHRVLKTGCRVEELQLKAADRIKPAIVLYMIVAWRVVYVMKMGRECPNLPCDVIFDEAEWRAVYHIVKRRKAIEKPTLGEMVKLVASLGGFHGRKGDGNPGAQSMWTGIMRARDFALAWLVFTGRMQEV